jgi:hypothetical protein
MDYLIISNYIALAEYRLTVIAMKRHELVYKGGWSASDEALADALDAEHEELLEAIEEARDALSQCD